MLRRLTISLIALFLAADVPAQEVAADKPEPFIARGRVTNTAGEPIAGATVNFKNTMFYQSSAQVKTAKDGTYRVELTRGAWHATAHLTATYHKQKYRFDLCPDDPDDFAGNDGAVRNFVWKLTGERPGDEIGEYGAKVIAYMEPGDISFELQDVELTLTPEGPLVDGSQGKEIVGKLERSPDGDCVRDVPLARYRIKARLAPKDGPAVPLLVRVRNSDAEFAKAVTADFKTPHGSTLPIHWIELEVKKR